MYWSDDEPLMNRLDEGARLDRAEAHATVDLTPQGPRNRAGRSSPGIQGMQKCTPLFAGMIVSLMALACGKASSPTAPTPTVPDPTVPSRQSQHRRRPRHPRPTSGPINHVFLVVEENASADAVMGGSQMPYLNSLATHNGSATQDYADAHPSIGNYFMLTVGNTVTNNNNFSGIVTDDNIVRQLLAAGKTWKSYAEDLPSVGYTGGDTGGYARKHNVLALLADVVNNPAQAGNLVPFSQFSSDLASNAFPNYSFIVPNLCNDGHDCPLTTADAWLQTNIAPLVNSAQFQRDGLLIVCSTKRQTPSSRAEEAVSHGLPLAREPSAGIDRRTCTSMRARCD